jgi:hypothetical protein
MPSRKLKRPRAKNTDKSATVDLASNDATVDIYDIEPRNDTCTLRGSSITPANAAVSSDTESRSLAEILGLHVSDSNEESEDLDAAVAFLNAPSKEGQPSITKAQSGDETASRVRTPCRI